MGKANHSKSRAWGECIGNPNSRAPGEMSCAFELDSNSKPRATGENQPGIRSHIRTRLADMKGVFKLDLNSRAPGGNELGI